MTKPKYYIYPNKKPNISEKYFMYSKYFTDPNKERLFIWDVYSGYVDGWLWRYPQ